MKVGLTVFVCSVIVGALLCSGIAYSQDENPIDVVLVMDSSGSMKKTDPNFLRIPAAKLFISLLDEKDRAGIVSFSDKGYPISYLAPVDSQSNRDLLFKATEKISSRGVHTNLHDALSKGFEVLSRDKRVQRTQIIILMSDGMMDVGDPEEGRRLRDKTREELTAMLKKSGVRVYSIAFTEHSDRELLERLSRKTGGFYNLAGTDKDFHLIFTSIFESLKAPEMIPVSKNGFFIDGSVEEVTIIATKGSPKTEIKINAPDGKRYSYVREPYDAEWFVSDNFDMITVKNPVAGRWEILFSTGENNKAYIITNLRLQTNFDQLYAPFGEPLDIQIWIEKDGSTITEQELLNKIDIYIELSGPDGKTTKLKPFHEGDGIFHRRVAFFVPGNYRLGLIAKGKTFEREKTFLFNVAGAKESKEVIEAQRNEEKTEPPVEEKPREDEQALREAEQNHAEDVDTDQISWSKIITKFISINLVLGVILLIYIKRKSIKGIKVLTYFIIFRKIGNLIKRKKEEDQESQTEQVEEETRQNRVEQAIQEEPIEQPNEESHAKEDEQIERDEPVYQTAQDGVLNLVQEEIRTDNADQELLAEELDYVAPDEQGEHEVKETQTDVAELIKKAEEELRREHEDQGQQIKHLDHEGSDEQVGKVQQADQSDPIKLKDGEESSDKG